MIGFTIEWLTCELIELENLATQSLARGSRHLGKYRKWWQFRCVPDGTLFLRLADTPVTTRNKNSPRAFFQALRFHQMVLECLERALTPVGLTAPQYTVLGLVRHFEPISSAELARKLRIKAQSTGETVKSLEMQGFICRNAVPNNKRSFALTLAPEGKQIVDVADELVYAAEETFFFHVPRSDRIALDRAIQSLRHRYEI